MGGIGNSATGIISFIVIWFLVGAHEEMEVEIRALRQKINNLVSEKSDLEKRSGLKSAEHDLDWWRTYERPE